jgi:hypothetical protein
MIDIWNQIKTIVFQRSFFKVPFWIWFGPVSILALSSFMFKLQPAMMPLALFFGVLGVFASAEFKTKGVIFSSSVLCLFSMIFFKNIQDPAATYWLYVFGVMTSFLVTAYSVEEYESFIFAQAEESKKNNEDVKLWQSRFESGQIRLEREKERFEKIIVDFEKQEENYLERIDQLEKMFHSSSYELKQEQNRGYNLHKELKKLLIDRYDLQVEKEQLHAEVQLLKSQIENTHVQYEAEILHLTEEKQALVEQVELLKAVEIAPIAEQIKSEEKIEFQEMTPQMIVQEVEKQIVQVVVDSSSEEPTEEENIYFSSF